MQTIVHNAHVLLIDSRVASIVELAESILLESQSCDPIDPQDYAKKFTRWSNSTFSFDAAYESILSCASACEEMHTTVLAKESNRLSPPIRCEGNDAMLALLESDALEGSLFEWWARAAEYFDLGVCDSFEKSLTLAGKHIRAQNFVPRLFGFTTTEWDDVDDAISDAETWLEQNNDEKDNDIDDNREHFDDRGDVLLFAMEETGITRHSLAQNSWATEATQKNAARPTVCLLQTVPGTDGSLRTELVSQDANRLRKSRLSAPCVANARCFAQVMFPVVTTLAMPTSLIR